MYRANWHEKVVANPNRWFFEPIRYETRRFSQIFRFYYQAEDFLYHLADTGHDIGFATITEEEASYSCFIR